ncbi:hypothetical protein [Pontibacter pamirensis]|uniref:hypothetical protein n=1 Tax=Pontibacter pamirensis TaxID=2562824 RepID=UPI001389ABF0|nr:hypothetical protein [Pontibacter pamirensis]
MKESERQAIIRRRNKTIEVLGIDNSFEGSDPIIYHYTNFEAAKKILGNASLRFGDPTNFEDKRDMDVGLITFDADKATYLKHTLRTMPEIPYERLLKISNHFDIYPRLFKEEAQKLLNEQKSKVGVICFTEENDNEYLWDKYGEGEKGVCIGIRVSGLEGFFMSKVKYSPAMLKVNFFDEEVEAYIHWALVKSTKFDKEKEIRVFCFDVQNICDSNRCIPLKKNSVDAVYFGQYMPESNQEELVKILKQKNYPDSLRLLKMVGNPEDYGYLNPNKLFF